MYAVVYKNRVIVGPMEWNRGIFQGSLERQGVKTLLPRSAPDTLPYIINEDAKILKVVENRPEINTMVEYYYGPLWDVSGETAVASYEVRDTEIEFARVNFKNLAAEERWKKEIKGTTVLVQELEVSIDTSRDGRNIFVQKYALMNDSDLVNWKFPEGWLTLSKSDLGLIVSTGASYIQSCFDWEKSICDQVDAAAKKSQLLEINILEDI
jgi:hypothetical protein